MNTLRFIGFIVALLGAGFLSAHMQKELHANPAAGKSFWFQEKVLLLNYSMIFVFVYLLSGFWNWALVAAAFSAAHLGIAAFFGLSALLGREEDRYYDRTLVAGAEVAQLNNRYRGIPLFVLKAIMAILWLGYLVSSVWIYFYSSLSGSDRAILVLQTTLIAILFRGFIGNLSYLLPLLLSRNLDEDTRARVFVEVLASMIPQAILFAFAFSGFSETGKDWRHITSALLSASSLYTWMAIVGLFVVVVFLPFIIGRYRAKAWRDHLARRRRKWLTRAATILAVPTSADYVDRLRELRGEIAQEQNELLTSDQMAALGEAFQCENVASVDPAARILIDAHLSCREIDPRFAHLDWLAAFAEGREFGLGRISADIDAKASEAEKIQLAKRWSKEFRLRKTEQEEDRKFDADSRSPVLVIVTAIVTPISSAILGGIGTYLWKLFEVSPKP